MIRADHELIAGAGADAQATVQHSAPVVQLT